MANTAAYFPAAKIAYWYFRLNGFLGIENFVLHPEGRDESQRTEADFCGVRFQYRCELNMEDDAPFKDRRKSKIIVIAEITKAACKLNEAWTNPNKENIQYVLSAIGASPHDANDAVAKSLYTHCIYPEPTVDREPLFQMIAVGRTASEDLQRKFPGLLQLELDAMLKFIYQRFAKYRYQKVDHSQWDKFGQVLWGEAEKQSQNAFVEEILGRM
jgi:hypothetical protein